MEISIYPLSGQSNYDLCFQGVGGLDGFIGYLSLNEINLSSVPPITSVKFNTNSIISRVISGNKFATYAYISNLVPLLNNDGTPLLNNNGQPLYNN